MKYILMPQLTDYTKIKRIDKWEIDKYISKGAYAYVYDVSHNKSNYILKWMLPHTGDKDAIDRFDNEMWALKQLNHPSIPEFIDFGNFEGRPYIIQTKVPGKTLAAIRKERLKEGSGANFGEVRILNLLVDILGAVEYMHSQGFHHRDLKDDNILTNESDSIVSIVDLGVCFSEKLPHEINTFRGGVGSARYCPPSKLQMRKSDESHDIFAIGVLGYLLLTNSYPWEVPEDSNVQDLLDLMLNKPPNHLHVFNPEITTETSKFILSLITIEDENRPHTKDALVTIKKLLSHLSTKKYKQESTTIHSIVLPKVTLDPIHGDIRFTYYEQSIINSREFQRLRYIKQLGFANLVFYGADHSRFSHAIGTLQVTNKILSNIESRGEQTFTSEEKLLARCYALVHDINHIAFGHTIEDELNFFKRHDDNYARLNSLIFSKNSHLGNILRDTEFGREILNYYENKSFSEGNIWIKEMIESSCGADVLDYIDRDAHYCGLDHKIDSALYRRLTVNHRTPEDSNRHYMTKVHGGHGHRADAEFAIESVMKERYALFLKVYTHPTKIAASAMLGKALTELLYDKKQKLIPKISAQLDWIGDVELLLMLKGNQNMIGKIGRMLIERVLYKPVFRSQIITDFGHNVISSYELKRSNLSENKLFDPLDRKTTEETIAKSAKLDPSEIIVYCCPKPPGFQKAKLYVDNKSGKTIHRDESIGTHIEYLKKHLGLWFIYVFVHPDVDDKKQKKVAHIANQLFNMENQLSMPRVPN